LLACLGALVGAPIAWSIAEPAQAVAEAALGKAQDLADLLGQRSPGTRTQDQLTKHARALAKTHPKVSAPADPAGPDAPSTGALVDLLLQPPAPVEIAAADEPKPFTPSAGLAAILESTPGFTAPGGNGGGHQSFPSSEPREVIPQASAVPEPGTWAMMLMGFGLVAWRVRRRGRPSGRAKRVLN
jgi:hypothetical protein